MADSSAVSLDDKYRLDARRALITGRQALVRLPLVQRELDRRAGLNTAGLISGYRGSPLGGYDAELWKAEAQLKANNIRFQPGLNEDLALTALQGSQQLGFLPGARVDGVFAIWYGKGPGVDRSGDAIKHANLQGTAPHGGVLLVFGDDHAGKSSTTAHQSDLTLASWEVPVLYPSSVPDILRLGLAGIAMSRFSGALVGLKLVNETAEGSTVADLSPPAPFVLPDLPEPEGGVHIRRELLAVRVQDTRLLRHKLPRAQAFARANRLDAIVFGARAPRFLIATAGKAYADVLSALELLGIDEATAARIGLGVYRIALIFPLEPQALAEAALQAEEILFVEEKRPHAETQAKALFYGHERRVRISGKASPDGTPLLPADAPLDAAVVAAALAQRLRASIPGLETLLPGLGPAADRVEAQLARRQAGPPPAFRRPAFCPGCPHSVSTRVPEGSYGATGIGCHGMVLFHPERNPLPLGHMGAEGAAWIGLSPFTSTEHIFQNLGDGTYSHSGSLAIRAAVQGGVNITYKLLFNDAVAMTGGQPVEGALSVARVVAQARAEGVGRVVVVAEQPDRFHGAEALPAGTELRHRDELIQVQEALRREPGVTMLVYDQVCAAEKRRRRKAGSFPPAAARVFINPEVCEGCGDCSVQSSCLAIQPLETELGRKRRIDQSACNADTSCLKGFCPSFVTVEGARPRRAAGATEQGEAPAPPALRPIGEGFDLVIAGIGGTGVVTVSAVLGMAARIEGLGVSLFDMTGLSQKGGQVFSHLRLRADPDAVVPARVGPGEADVLLACDLVAGVQGEALETVAEGRTLVLANSDLVATAEFQRNRDLELPADAMVGRLAAAAGRAPGLIPAASLSQALLGDSIGANLLMLGAAWQNGAIPVSLAAIEEAIRLNGTAVQANLKAFAAGRRAAAGAAERPRPQAMELEDFIARRTANLVLYRNRAYAEQYGALLARVRAAAGAVAGGEAFAWAAARGAYKLMAYKDEYEVARLHADGRFKAALAREFEGGGRVRLYLSPPILARTDPRTGRPRKMAFGPWIFPALKLLAGLKGLRETPLDPFGGTAERRRERAVRDAYLARVAELAEGLSPESLEMSTALASAPLQVRGFGPVKAEAEAELLARLTVAA